MIRAKVLVRKHSKRLSKPDLKATLSDVCLVRRRSSGQIIYKNPGICFGKAIYRLPVCHRNPRDGYYFRQQNNDRIKTNEELDYFFVVALKRAVLNGSTKSCLKIFLNFTYEEAFTVSFTSFLFY